mgnify:CR=1 FL=1
MYKFDQRTETCPGRVTAAAAMLAEACEARRAEEECVGLLREDEERWGKSVVALLDG